MARQLSLLALVLLGCDLLLVDNPRNCVRNPSVCGREAFCNLNTQSCESLDCTINHGLCTASEICEPTTRRCTPQDCTNVATLCPSAQVCSALTRQCEVRTFVLGQPDEETNLNVAYGLRYPFAVAFVPNPVDATNPKLLVADAHNQRVLIWNRVPIQNRPADVVLGLPDVHTLSATGPYGGVHRGSLREPWSVSSDGTQLIVGDSQLNRLLMWSPLPSQPSSYGPIPASQLWGQTSFVNSQSNAGLPAVGPLGVSGPKGFVERLPGKSFFVTDSLNHRVLGFPGVPSTPQSAPAFVVGQTDFITATAGISATQLNGPWQVFSDGIQLFVADYRSHRVLAFSLPITQNGAAATLVFGQVDFTRGSPNQGGVASAGTLHFPAGISVLGGPSRRLFVADQGNNRVLRYTLPATTPDLVLGQSDFISVQPNRGTRPAANTLANPLDVATDGVRLAVADYLNQRVLLWSTLPTLNGAAADVVLGQPDAVSNQINSPPSRGARQFSVPEFVATDGTRLCIADAGNHRVLIWNELPSSSLASPDLVLGQTDFVQNLANAGLAAPTAATLSAPVGISIADGRIAIADSGNNRVLIWNQFPTQSATPADLVIGQPSFVSRVPQVGSGLNGPTAAVLLNNQLYVADSLNNRVVVFSGPLSNFAAASAFLGQPNPSSAVANFGGESAQSLAHPRALFIDPGGLLVADRNNDRVLVWNTLPVTTLQPADLVVGQSSFTSSYADPVSTQLSSPTGLLVNQGRLYVASADHNRILYWNQLPITSGQRASGVLGQTDFLATLPNNPDVMPIEKLSAPAGMATASGQLFIADVQNNRVVARGLPR